MLQRAPAALLPLLLKSALGYPAKTLEKSTTIYLSVQFSLPAPLSVLVASAAWWMTLPSRDSASGIIMEQVLAWSLTVPSSAHRFRLLPDPNLLKGPSDCRNRGMQQALGINFAWPMVLYHPYSSLAAVLFLPPFSSVLCWLFLHLCFFQFNRNG